MNTTHDARRRPFVESADHDLLARIDRGEDAPAQDDSPPASDKQIAYIESLLDTRDFSSDKGDTARAAASKALAEGDVSVAFASTIIDSLNEFPKRAPQADEGFRFTKHDGTWALKGVGEPGQVVEVSKSNGETKTMTLGAELADNVFAIGDERKDNGDGTEPDAGMYRLEDGAIVRVYLGQQSGQMLAKKLVGDGDHHEYEYMGKAARFINKDTARLTLDEAKAFGRMTGTCCVCARRLDVPESVEAGIGPVCAGRLA